MSDIIHAGDETFQKVVLESPKPVLVDFWAAWCGPCVAMNPILEQFVKAYGDRVGVVKVNVDQNQKLAMDYRITSIPNMKLFVGGKVVKEFVGAMPMKGLLKELGEYLPQA